MRQKHKFKIESINRNDININIIFEENMRRKSAGSKTTLINIYSFTRKVVGSDMEIEIDLETDTEYDYVDNGIQGGLAKAHGKGRVLKN